MDNFDEMLEIANILANGPYMPKKTVALVGGGGGHATILADSAEKYGLNVSEFSLETQNKLKQILLKDSVVKNPIDFVGASEREFSVYERCTEICLEDREVGGVIIFGVFGGYRIDLESDSNTYNNSALEIAEIVRKLKKPVVVHSIYATEGYSSIKTLRDNKICVYDSADLAAKCISMLYKYGNIKKKFSYEEREEELPENIRRERRNDVRPLFEDRHGLIPEMEAREILKKYNIPVCKTRVAQSEEELVKFGKEIGFPVVCKVLSEEIVHKTDVGGVRLNLSNERGLRSAYKEIMENVTKTSERFKIKGITVSPYLKNRQEVIVGFSRDEILGPIVAFGLGGIFVEVLKDISFRVAPLVKRDAEEMMQETQAYKLLTGVRGQKSVDIYSIVDILLKISCCALENPEIKELDLNPILVSDKDSEVVDVRMIV